MSQNNTFTSVIDFLLQPVPFLPDSSFIVGHGLGSKRKSKKPLGPSRSRPSAKDQNRAQTERAVTITGIIQRGHDTPYSVDGQDFEITPDTWIFGNIRYGVTASVQLVRATGAAYARKIIIQ